MSKRKLLILCIVFLSLVLVGIVGWSVYAFGFQMPYEDAANQIATGDVIIREQENGQLIMSWPATENADIYEVQFFSPGQKAPVYQQQVTSCQDLLLPQLPQGQTLTLRIRTGVYYEDLKGQHTRYSSNTIELSDSFQAPRVQDLDWTADTEADTVALTYTMAAGDQCSLYATDASGQPRLIRTTDSLTTQISFGEGKDLPLPGHQETVTLSLSAFRVKAGLQFYTDSTAQTQVCRDDLLGRDPLLQCQDLGYNQYRFTWVETKGDGYEVQRLTAPDTWEAVAQIPQDGELCFTTEYLPIFRSFSYRVVAVGGDVPQGALYAAQSESIQVTTKESPIFTTVWPIQDLPVYATAQSQESVGTVEASTAFCVLAEENGRFAIRLDGQTRYIDSNYCLINLPEYMGGLCRYHITNGDKCKYTVHEFAIPKLTGNTIVGYEYVKQQDGSYLVPLLYPTAKKLAVAAYAAKEQGYALKIYDAYRPYRTTREIYDVTELILDTLIPEKPYDPKVKIENLQLPAPQTLELVDANGNPITVQGITYRMVMTDKNYGLNAFLARVGSTHNLGIALDLTMVDLQTGEELRMQTSIHDLSAYSVTSKNNKYAKLLQQIMTQAGFGTLVSEWWHFQDNDTRSAISPKSMWGGVNAEGWVADNTGWRYRNKRGTYYQDKTVTIQGVAYSFDSQGYWIQSE